MSEPNIPWWRASSLGGLGSPASPAVIDHDEEALATLVAAQSRWGQVMDATSLYLNAGLLAGNWRGLYGGAYLEIPPTHWNTEEEINRRRFLLCRMDPRPEFAFTGRLDGPGFIYVTTQSLRAVIDLLNRNHPEAVSEVELDRERPEAETQPAQTEASDNELAPILDDTKEKLLELRAAFEKEPKGRWPVLKTAADAVASLHASDREAAALSKRIRRNFPKRHPDIEAKQPYYTDRMPAPKRSK